MFTNKKADYIICIVFVLIILTVSVFSAQNAICDYFKYNSSLNTRSAMLVVAASDQPKTVLLGGDSVGFEYQSRGVLVLGKNKLFIKDDFVDNFCNDEIVQGDIIMQVNGADVNTPDEICEILNNKEQQGRYVSIKAVRKGKIYETSIKPAYDLLTKKYKLGLWVKNTINGLGTLTYIDEQTGRFGALGHHILENNTGVSLPVNNGDLYGCTVLGIKRAVRGNTGEIKGLLKTNAVLGTVDKNISSGIYGEANELMLNQQRARIAVGGKHTVVPGKALMYCSIDGKNVRAYDIEIIKTNRQSYGNKDMVIKVTDNRLIKASGGIVQGMSGSPIVQNGKLIGAVTHVFINDATKGFGIYIDNMLPN